MSEGHNEEHSSPIKTPKQLVIVVALAFAVPIAIIVMLSQLVTSGGDTSKDNPALSDEAIAKRLKPVGVVEIIDPDAPKTEKSGKEVVEAVCGACHGSGALGSPKIGDRAAWGKLIAEGHARLTQTAIKGIRQMPPRGGNPDLSDTEMARAVAHMANQAGAAVGAAFASGSLKFAPAKADGKSTYQASCAACHGTGIAGAPKAGDKSAWAPRLKGGMEALYG
jgi:cytochrome c5